VGNDTTEGIMSLSQSGPTVVFTGYRANVGAANPSAATPDVVNRVVGTVGPYGIVNTSVAVTDVSGTIRSATSTDGSSLFYAGASTGLRYVGSPSGAATSVQIDARNSRQALLNGGNTLFASSTLAGNTAKVLTYGTLPTTATTGTAAVSQGLTDTLNGVALFDLSPSVAGVDTMYTLNTVLSRLYKYTFNGTSWNLNGFIASNGAVDLAGATTASGVNLFLTKGSTLYGEVDTSGYGANITGSLSQLALAGANTAFRGIVVIPEPSTLSLGLLAGATLLALRRRRS
jgi:hypothetical protein